MSNQAEAVVVTVTKRKKLWGRVKAMVAQVKFEKPYLLLWRYNMFLNLCFFAQGLIGLLTLGAYMPWWTGKASKLVSIAKSDITQYEKAKTESKQEVEKETQKQEEVKDVSKSEMIRRMVEEMATKREYDMFGNVISINGELVKKETDKKDV